MRWVDLALKPYISNALTGVHQIFILIFIAATCCMMLLIRSINMGDEIQHIHAGCMCQCQPVDVGYNKPFKNHIRRLWHDWIIELVEPVLYV